MAGSQRDRKSFRRMGQKMISAFFLGVKQYWKLFAMAFFILWSVLMIGAGVKIERGRWEKAEALRLKIEADQRVIITEIVRKKEASHAVDVSVIDADGLKKIKDLDDEKNRRITELLATNQRLSVRLKAKPSSGVCETGSGASLDHGETRAELHDDVTRFLVGRSSKCDEITVQLEAAQKLLEADREAVNGSL